MSRTRLHRLSGSLLLILLLSALFYARSAWAASKPADTAEVTVRVSPLTLLLQNEVTIKVGDTTCSLLNGFDPLSLCTDLAPGTYQVSAAADGYFVTPSSYELVVPGDSDQDADDQNSDDQDSDNQDSDDYSDHNAAVSGQIRSGNETNGVSNNDFFFNLYQNNYQLYMPNLHVGE